jgi:hypothetical protein
VSQFEEDFDAEVEQTVENMLLSARSQRQRRSATEISPTASFYRIQRGL